MADGSRVVLDAGTGLRALGRLLSGRAPSQAGTRDDITILLSHRHSDHVLGLPHFEPIVTRSHRVRMACGGVEATALRELVVQQLSAPLFPTLEGIAEAIVYDAFDGCGRLAVSDACTVDAMPARHPGGASILCVRDAVGLLVAYAPDNELSMEVGYAAVSAWRDALREALAGVPLLIHDATYVNDELPAHRGWGHSSAEEATQFAMQCGAETLLLMHHHPDRSDDDIDVIVGRCRLMAAEAGSPLRVTAAAEGLSVNV